MHSDLFVFDCNQFFVNDNVTYGHGQNTLHVWCVYKKNLILFYFCFIYHDFCSRCCRLIFLLLWLLLHLFVVISYIPPPTPTCVAHGFFIFSIYFLKIFTLFSPFRCRIFSVVASHCVTLQLAMLINCDNYNWVVSFHCCLVI